MLFFFSFAVLDVNDESVVFERPIYHARVSEAAPRGHFISKVSAYDPDIMDSLRFAIIGQSHHYGTAFEIDEKSGLSRSLPYVFFFSQIQDKLLFHYKTIRYVLQSNLSLSCLLAWWFFVFFLVSQSIYLNHWLSTTKHNRETRKLLAFHFYVDFWIALYLVLVCCWESKQNTVTLFFCVSCTLLQLDSMNAPHVLMIMMEWIGLPFVVSFDFFFF